MPEAIERGTDGSWEGCGAATGWERARGAADPRQALGRRCFVERLSSPVCVAAAELGPRGDGRNSGVWVVERCGWGSGEVREYHGAIAIWSEIKVRLPW